VRRRTLRGPALRVRLYEKAGCGLCAEVYRALTRIGMDVALEIERVDIEGDPALFDRYAVRIPVIGVRGEGGEGGEELDAAGLDEVAIRRFLARG